jgi:hypothetical protein
MTQLADEAVKKVTSMRDVLKRQGWSYVGGPEGEFESWRTPDGTHADSSEALRHVLTQEEYECISETWLQVLAR